LVGKAERKKSLGGPMHESEDNIKIDLKRIHFEVVDWVQLP
jgi:hypothetical protein